MSKRNVGRRGFTLIEVMVAIVVGLVMMGVIYNLFHTSNVVSRRTEGKTEAVQSAVIALESIKRDLRQLVSLPVPPTLPTGLPGDHRHPVVIAQDGTGVSFYVPSSGIDRDATRHLRAVPVRYQLLPTPTQSLYLLGRFAGENGDPANPAGTATGRNVGAVSLRYLHFRLLDPNGSGPNRSPDRTYYVEVSLVGTDSKGREQHFVRDLTPLEFPTLYASLGPIASPNTYLPMSAGPVGGPADPGVSGAPPATGTPIGGILEPPTNLPPNRPPPADGGPDGDRLGATGPRPRDGVGPAGGPAGGPSSRSPAAGGSTPSGTTPAGSTPPPSTTGNPPRTPPGTPPGGTGSPAGNIEYTFWASYQTTTRTYGIGPDGRLQELSSGNRSGQMAGGGQAAGTGTSGGLDGARAQSQQQICDWFRSQGVSSGQCP